MWASIIKAVLYLAVGIFLMWVLAQVLDPITSFAMAGEHADQAQVQTIGTYFDALTLENLTLLISLAVGIYLLGRAAVETNLG